MKILVDENIPKMTVRALEAGEHDVLDIRGGPQEGLPDSKLWQLAQKDERLLVTTDKGFAHRRDSKHAGILILRLRKPNRQRIHERVLAVLDRIPEDEWPNLMVTIRDRLSTLWRYRSDD